MEAGSRLVALSLLLSLLSLCVCAFNPKKIVPLLFEEQLLWVSGFEGEVNTYRIPLISFTPKGSLLAFSEARKFNDRDLGQKFIAMKRSTDKGATWSATSFIIDDGAHIDGLNLGCVVVDEEHGLVIVVYVLCFNHDHCSPSSIMMVESKDDGLNWSQPRNLSVQLGVKAFAPGPGFGIQKRYNPAKGRLVVCGHGTLEENGVFCILSDDHGKNWYNGAALKSIPYNQKKKPQDFSPDECQPVELKDGSIVINVRNQNNYHCRCRMVVRSFDGGLTLPMEHLFFHNELVDPAVAAGALEKDGVLYFTNPSHEHNRVNLTLRWSLNGGHFWENQAMQIWSLASGYSSITSLDSGSADDEKYIFVIYEKGSKSYEESISIAKIHLFGGR